MATVTRIAATINPVTASPFDEVKKRRVAGYARVSTDSDEQFTSYEAQIANYEKEIKKNPEWQFVRIYADEAKTGTRMKSRKGFLEMIDDCKKGLIDLIVTKSISRFARNTVDAISTTRELKKINVEVYFEKENLWTFDPKTEMALTIYCSLAQEESHSISQNVTIGKRWGFAQGKVQMPFKNFLGYDRGDDGKPVINEEQAEVVRAIYQMYLLDGMTSFAIAAYLNENDVPTPSRKKGCRWTKNVVDSILTNEKYKGDALLQKGYVPDFLEHKVVKNNGVLDQYYVKNHHAPIIDEVVWNQVQAEFKRRKGIGKMYSSSDFFSTKLVCGCCGGFYGKKVWHSNDIYRREVYQCNQKYAKGKDKCKTPVVTEEEIKEKFIHAYNQVMTDKDRVIQDTKEVIDLLTDTSGIDEALKEYEAERDVAIELANKLLDENKKKIQDQKVFEEKYNEYLKRHNKAKKKIAELKQEKLVKEGNKDKMLSFLHEVEAADAILTEWNDSVWKLMVESGIVNEDKTITFKFKNGAEVKI